MSRPCHVVCVLHSLALGGTENGVVNLVNTADPARFRFTLVLLHGDGTLAARLERTDVPVHTVRRRRGRDPLLALRLAALLSRIAPEVVHTRGYSCIEGILAARLAGVRAVVHGEHGRDADEVGGMKRRRAALRSLLFGMADAVVTVSDELRRSLLAEVRVAPERVVRIANGVDLRRFAARRDRRGARQRLGLPAQARVIGSVGRLDPVKDHATLLAAFARLRDAGEDLRLVLAGEGPERAQLEALAARLGIADRVRLLGSRDDVPQVLDALDVFALPSLTEGMSNALLEAMAAGLPCVATRAGGNDEVVVEAQTGLLVPARDPQALAAALRSLVSDPARSRAMGEAGRSRVESSFDLSATVARYEALYSSLAQRRGIPRDVEALGLPRAATLSPRVQRARGPESSMTTTHA